MDLSYQVSSRFGHQSVFQPGEGELRWLGLEVLRLQTGESWQGRLRDEEAALVVLSGRCAVALDGRESSRWKNLGSRSDIFDGCATAVYVPRQSALEVVAESKLELAIAKAPCDVDLPPTLVAPSDVRAVSAGAANWRRDVRLIIPPGSRTSHRLIVGETFNPSGNWSGIPPHKHDTPSDAENRLEEYYFFKTKPTDGYAVQLVYRDNEKCAHIVGNDEVIVFLNGYHPTVAAPGATVCYLWVLAGERKDYAIATDPRFGWVSSTETVIKELRH